jgi:hypothetical protein
MLAAGGWSVYCSAHSSRWLAAIEFSRPRIMNERAGDVVLVAERI